MVKGITKEEMESKLKRVITDAAESGNLNNVNWAELPLPQQMIQEERKQNLELIEQGKRIEQLTQSVLALTEEVHAAVGKP